MAKLNNYKGSLYVGSGFSPIKSANPFPLMEAHDIVVDYDENNEPIRLDEVLPGKTFVLASTLSTKQDLYDAIIGSNAFGRSVIFLDGDNQYCRAISMGGNDVYFFNPNKHEMIYFVVNPGDNGDDLIGNGIRIKLSSEQDTVKIVRTALEMQEIIDAVISGDEGGRYMYLGETTVIEVSDGSSYRLKKGGIYQITTEGEVIE